MDIVAKPLTTREPPMQKNYTHWYPNPEEDAKLEEELGAENERVRRQIRDAEILASFPEVSIGEALKPKIRYKPTANSRQIAGDHYKKMDIQPWDVIDFGPREQALGFYRYNALKYIMRAGEKGEFKEDIAKAQHYLEKLLEILE